MPHTTYFFTEDDLEFRLTFTARAPFEGRFNPLTGDVDPPHPGEVDIISIELVAPNCEQPPLSIDPDYIPADLWDPFRDQCLEAYLEGELS